MTLRTKAVLAALAFATLAPAAASAQGLGQGSDCGAANLQFLVGHDIDLIESQGYSARYIRPGDLITLDWLPYRLNVASDHTGNVTRVYCG